MFIQWYSSVNFISVMIGCIFLLPTMYARLIKVGGLVQFMLGCGGIFVVEQHHVCNIGYSAL